MRYNRLLVLAFGLAWASALFAAGGEQRKIISDFEDAGTWRVIRSSGTAPGAWFAGVVWMGGSQNAKFDDDWVGELRFNFASDTTAPRLLAFRRVKMSLVSGFLDGIEFDADSRGHPVSLRFVLLDSTKKRHTTPPVRLGPAGWRHYRLKLDASTWPGIKSVRFPACVEQVVLESDSGGEGSVFIDNLALDGEFARADRLTATPIYSEINYEPGAPVVLDYRVRNATEDTLPLAGRLTVKSVADGAVVFSGRARATVGGYGEALLRFDAPALPIGAYEATLAVEGGALSASYDDSFGVFHPNGARVNRKPMWFGVQDTTPWQGEGENRLHMEWMKQIGFDLNRVGMTGGRFIPSVELSLQGWRNLLQPFEDAGIDVSLLYFETPPWLIEAGKGSRTPPTDEAAFARYAADIGRFLAAFPHVKYVEFWNEPDINFFKGSLSDYWAMLAAFSKGLRSTAPGIKITTGGATVKHPRAKPGFDEGLYSTHGDLYDIAAFHAHGPLENYVEREQMVEGWQAEGGLKKPIANTESGERSAYNAEGRAEQAITLVKKITYAKSRPRSEFYEWFTLQDYWDMDPDVDDSFGLVTSDNRAKPALVAYNELIRELANTEPEGSPVRQEGMASYAFKRDDGSEVLVCWATEGGATLWVRSPEPVTEVNLFGRPETVTTGAGIPVPVGKAPVYLVSKGAMSFLGGTELPLEAPAEIYRDATTVTVFPVVVRNLSGKEGGRRLALKTASGAVLWSDSCRLKPGEAHTFSASVPASAGASLSTTRFTLELTEADARAISVPVVVHDSYVIAGGAPAVIALKTAQDVRELTFDPSIPAWKGPDDLSVEARVRRDGDSVIFDFDVTDDKHVQHFPDAELWRGDSVQVAFYNPATKAHTLFDLGLRGGESVAWCNKDQKPSLQGRWNLPVTIRRDGTHTLYHIAVPFSYLGVEAIPADGLPLGFAFLVNEDDGQGRVRWMHWKGGLGDNQDIQQLGQAIIK